MRNKSAMTVGSSIESAAISSAFEGVPIAKMYVGNWSDYEEMMMEKFGKDLQPHRVKYRQLKR